MDLILFAVIFLVISMLLLPVIIRGAIDSSKLTRQLVALSTEIQMLRKEINENKHINDKRN